MDKYKRSAIEDYLRSAVNAPNWQVSAEAVAKAVLALSDAVANEPPQPAPAQAQEPRCPICGGKMVWSPYNNELYCDKTPCAMTAIVFRDGTTEAEALALFARITGQGGGQ